MSIFLDTLKERFADSQRRQVEATQKFQRAQAELQSIQQEFNSLQIVLQREAAREQAAAATKAIVEHQPALAPQQLSQVVSIGEPRTGSEINKTDLVREVLQRHPAGMAPAELWREVKNDIPNKSYVYAVLGRLKDREQVTVRRGKYVFRAAQKTEDAKNINIQ